MRIITEPRVHLFSKQVFIPHPDYRIPEDGSEAVKIGAFAAKGCYDSFLPHGRRNTDNQREVKEHRHGSVFEHVVFGLFIEGISRALSLELNRHRPFAISQRSTRYTKEDDAAIVLDPYYAVLWNRHESKLGWGNNDEADILVVYEAHPEAELLAEHINTAATAFAEYRREVEQLMQLNPEGLSGFALRKWARGKARNILPHALETRGSYTGNVRAWRWFIESRSALAAESEIRRLAFEVWKVLVKEAPAYFDDFQPGDEKDGIPELVTPYSKV